MPATDLSELATQAYVYGFPLVFDLEQVHRYVLTGAGGNPPAPFNTFSHARTLAGPKDTFVSINNDTVYSLASIDLSVGPVLLTVPDSAGRYYVLQFVDAWTNNFAYVGKRATGTAAGTFLLVEDGWEGDVAEAAPGATVIHFPTRIASIVGRWACDGVDDLPAVHALQDAMTLEPLLQMLTPPSGLEWPEWHHSEALQFWERYRMWSQEFLPAERDLALQDSFAPLGLTGDTHVTELGDDVIAALEEGYAAGRALLQQILHSGSSPVVNNWSLTYHVFDYNLDFFEVGALDDPKWKLAEATRIPERAAAALAGLWGNHAYEAAYAMVYLDADGDALDGTTTYRLQLSPPPPVDAFWSLTMYSQPDFFLIENPIDRYSIGDRTPGIIRDAEGGVTITISAERPTDATEAANWLPAPAGPFRPILRLYSPAASVVDGGYEIPAITKA
ncbi:DUF1254 domain-containing protein [Leifsonia sp. Leaf264]|uniref:DUF1254 domain-containing protein n=1 Tax=Leifsonia sp. Leaf264 TaxID=1736314 RepID=UPI0006F5EFA3|nr:DUF1254 domain-containing protein [Leifsonia sp. Leaf264]KQO95443.1 ATP synthase subunit alpha [Leifsonia sp. Leaf264]